MRFVMYFKYMYLIILDTCIWCNPHVGGIPDTCESGEQNRREARGIYYGYRYIHANPLG